MVSELGNKQKTYLLVDSAIKHQLDSNTTWDTDSLSHGRVTTDHTILAHGAGACLLGAILVLDFELVLQHNHVTLLGAVLHLLLECGTEGIERVTAGDDLLVREDADPAETRDEAVALLVVREGGLGGDGPLEVLLGGGCGTQDLFGGVLPGDGGVEEVGGLIAQEADVDQHLDHLREALIAESTTDDGLGFGDVVALAVGSRVTVGVRDEGEARVDVVGLGGSHKVGTGDADFLAVLVELGGVTESEKDTTARPGELVAQRVVGAFRGGETTTVGEEGGDFTTFPMNLLF